MSRPVSPRVLITLGWVLLLPVGAVVMIMNGFVRDTWNDTQYEGKLRRIVRQSEPDKRLVSLAAKSRQAPLAPAEREEHRRLIHQVADRAESAVRKLAALHPQEKYRLYQADVAAMVAERALNFRELATALDTGDPAAVAEAQRRAGERRAARQAER